MSPSYVLQALQRRYATKVFDPRINISREHWDLLESALLLTPSGYGLQPWKFFIIHDPEVRKKLRGASLGQIQVEDCSHFVVFAARNSIDQSYIDSHISVVAKVRNMPKAFFGAYFQMMVGDLIDGPKSEYIGEWAARQAYIALGTLVTTAAMLKIDTCPLEGIIPEQYDEILELKDTGYRTLAACAVGYRDPSDKYADFPKARFEKNTIIRHINIMS
jgi:nitroreductase